MGNLTITNQTRRVLTASKNYGPCNCEHCKDDITAGSKFYIVEGFFYLPGHHREAPETEETQEAKRTHRPEPRQEKPPAPEKAPKPQKPPKNPELISLFDMSF